MSLFDYYISGIEMITIAIQLHETNACLQASDRAESARLLYYLPSTHGRFNTTLAQSLHEGRFDY